MTPKKCTKGYMWVQYDQGNPSYGYALAASFDVGKPHPIPKTMTVWKWVPKGTADTVRGVLPKEALAAQGHFQSREVRWPGHCGVSAVTGWADASEVMWNEPMPGMMPSSCGWTVIRTETRTSSCVGSQLRASTCWP